MRFRPKLWLFLSLGLGMVLFQPILAHSQKPQVLMLASMERTLTESDRDALFACSLQELLNLASFLPQTANGHRSLLLLLRVLDEVLGDREQGELFSELVVTKYRDDFGVRYLEHLLLEQEEAAARLLLHTANRVDAPWLFAYAFIGNAAAAWKHRKGFANLPHDLRMRLYALEAITGNERTSADAQYFATVAAVQNLAEPEILRAVLVGGGDPRMPVLHRELGERGQLSKLREAAVLELKQAEQFIAQGRFPENGRLLTLFLRTLLTYNAYFAAWARTEILAIADTPDSPVRALLAREVERALRGRVYAEFAIGRAVLIRIGQAFGVLNMETTEREFAALEASWRRTHPRRPLPGMALIYRSHPLRAFRAKDLALLCQEKVDDGTFALGPSALF